MQGDDPKCTKAAAKIQSLIKGVLTRERVKRMAKDFFRRKMIIKELLDTEENYIRDLSIIVSDFQTPLINKKIISREQAETIFMNIDQIRQLNELFFATIFEAASNYWHFKVIFDKIEKEIHFFKLYFEYLNNYTLSSLMVDELMKHKDFEDFINKARLNPYHKLLSLKDYLIKPVQRLPKYVLIMKEVKKRTPTDHPDYRNIEIALKLFEEVNQSNNDKLNRVLDNLKITEIEKKLNLPHPISEPGVEFVLEQPVTVVTHEGHIVQATLYLLNTELIVSCKSGGQKEKMLAIVPFKNGGASIMSNEQHYFYKDTFTVQNGQGDSCMFLCPRQEDRQLLIQKIYNELIKAEKRTLDKLSALCNVKNREGVEFLKKMTRLDLLPDIQILGTDERNDNMFKYTVYIIEIRIKSIKQKVFLRFKELLQLQQEIQRQYGLTLKNALFKTPWVTNHKPKKIEQRKIAIQRFLKEILSRQEIIEHGQEILTRIGLPEDFYKLPQIYKDSQSILRKSALFQRETSEKSSVANKSIMYKSRSPSIFASIHELHMEEYEKQPFRNRPKSRQISIQDILKANELHLGHFTRYTQIMFNNKKPRENITFDILIPWIENEKGFVRQRLQMQSDERVSNLIENLSKQIGLKYFKDFRINLQREYAGRILDDDECLPKVMQQMKCGKYLLIFKKVIYVSSDIQQHELRSDRVRLKIIASQVIYDCKKDKYLIDYQLILRLSTFIGILQIFADEEEKDDEEIERILEEGNLALRTRNLVTNTYTTFYDGPATWKQDYRQALKLVLKKLEDISRRNYHVFRTSGIHNEEREYNTTQLGQLAAISIITEMKNNVFFGSISFVVQISQWFRKFLMKFGDEDEESYDNRNCWLIIKYDSMHLYSISLQTRIFSFTYEELYKIEPYPSSILLHLRDRQIDLLKLKTANSYSIREMLLYYKNYNDIIKRMQQDESFEGTILELAREESRHNISIRSFNS